MSSWETRCSARGRALSGSSSGRSLFWLQTLRGGPTWFPYGFLNISRHALCWLDLPPTLFPSSPMYFSVPWRNLPLLMEVLLGVGLQPFSVWEACALRLTEQWRKFPHHSIWSSQIPSLYGNHWKKKNLSILPNINLRESETVAIQSCWGHLSKAPTQTGQESHGKREDLSLLEPVAQVIPAAGTPLTSLAECAKRLMLTLISFWWNCVSHWPREF